MGLLIRQNKLCFLEPTPEDYKILRSWKLNPISFFSLPSKMQSNSFMTAEVVVSVITAWAGRKMNGVANLPIPTFLLPVPVTLQSMQLNCNIKG